TSRTPARWATTSRAGWPTTGWTSTPAGASTCSPPRRRPSCPPTRTPPPRCAGRRAPDGSPPGEHRLLEVGHPGVATVQHHLAELVEHGGGRRVHVPAEDRQLDDRRVGLGDRDEPGID